MSKYHKLSIKEIKKETPNAVSVVFTIPSELTNDFGFTAGQYVNIKPRACVGERNTRRSWPRQ